MPPLIIIRMAGPCVLQQAAQGCTLMWRRRPLLLLLLLLLLNAAAAA
jgi:hypothetical protein